MTLQASRLPLADQVDPVLREINELEYWACNKRSLGNNVVQPIDDQTNLNMHEAHCTLATIHP